MRKLTLQQVLEANLSELLELMLGDLGPSPELAYCEILSSYLRSDLEELTRLITDASARSIGDPLFEIIHALAQARLGIRRGEVTCEGIDDLLALRPAPASTELWKGEILFVAALGSESIGDQARACDLYRRSARALEEADCPKRAIKALHNALSAESRIHSHKDLIVEYHHLSRKALAAGERGFAGLALMNISREYQKVGSLEAALKHCDQALELLASDFGTIHYYLTRVHRAHLLEDLGRRKDSDLELEEASVAPFQQVQDAITVVRAMKSKLPPQEELDERLLPTWRERIAGLRARLRNSSEKPAENLETKLEALLDSGSHDKFELAERLYGSQLPFSSVENRLKNLLNRLRKRHPGRLSLVNGKYTLKPKDKRERRFGP